MVGFARAWNRVRGPLPLTSLSTAHVSKASEMTAIIWSEGSLRRPRRGERGYTRACERRELRKQVRELTGAASVADIVDGREGRTMREGGQGDGQQG